MPLGRGSAAVAISARRRSKIHNRYKRNCSRQKPFDRMSPTGSPAQTGSGASRIATAALPSGRSRRQSLGA